MANRSITTESFQMNVGGIEVPVTVSWERRRNARISAASKCVYLRLPHTRRSFVELPKHLEWTRKWLLNLHERKPGYLHKYRSKSYADGEQITILDQPYRIKWLKGHRKRLFAEYSNSTLALHIPENLSNPDSTEIKRSIIRASEKAFKNELISRLDDINSAKFEKSITDVIVRYTKTKWGSCSIDGKIRLSTRLMLLNPVMRDYVIVHELAHLTEFHHGEAFWKLVGSVDPHYRKKERWLNKHGHLYDF